MPVQSRYLRLVDIVEEKKFKALLRRMVGIPVIALAILAALLLVEIQALRNSLRGVEHADQVINADRELIKLTVDMQTDVRGFLYTGKSEFLQPYKESVQIINSEFTTLNQLVSDDPGQQARLAAIHRRFDEWQQQAEHSIELRHRSLPPLDIGEGGYESSLQRNQMRASVRADHDAFTAAEAQLRAERKRMVERRSGILVITILLAPLVGGGLAMFTSRQIRLLAERFKESLDIAGKRAEALHEQAELLDLAHDTIMVRDLHGTIRFWNHGAEEMYGYSKEQATGKIAQELLHTIFLRPSAEIDAELLRKGRWEGELTRATKDGKPAVVNTHWVLQRDKDGMACGVMEISTDITEYKRAEEESKRSKHLLEMFVENAPAALAMFNRNMCYVRVSKKWDEVCRLEGGSILGKSHYELFPNLPEHWKEAHRRGLAGESLGAEEEWVAGDGTKRTVRWAIHPWGDSGTETGGIIIFSEDITQRKQTELALLRSEKLASVGRMAAVIAHEINNPLAATMNAVYLALNMKNLPTEARRYLEMADAELKRIAHITRQSLGFYRESNAPARMTVQSVLNSAVDLLSSRIKAKHAAIERQWEEDVEITAVAGELRQVFSNLLANSLDALDDHGTVKLRVSSGTGLKGGQRCVRVTIADNGKGIAANLRPHIFEPFFTTKGTIGTGLGLWVTKEIIDKHGGTIQVRSNTREVRRGTVFSVVLPVEPTAAARGKSAGD
jgi:PAS domain S-box-containing protein